MEAARFSVGIL